MPYVIMFYEQECQNMKEAETYVIDLYKIKGNGEFKCPKCGTKISPDDLSEDTYRIMETQVREDHIEKVILQCKKCGSNLHLTGFQSLEHLD